MAGNKARRQRRAQQAARSKQRGESGRPKTAAERAKAERVARTVAAQIVAHDDAAAAKALLHARDRPSAKQQKQQQKQPQAPQERFSGKKRARSDSTDPESRRPAKVTLTAFAPPTLRLEEDVAVAQPTAEVRLAHAGKLSRDLLESLEEAHVAREAELAKERARKASARIGNARPNTKGNVFAALANDDDEDEEDEDNDSSGFRRKNKSKLFFAPSTLIIDQGRQFEPIFGGKGRDKEKIATSESQSQSQSQPRSQSQPKPAMLATAAPEDNDDDL